MIAQKKPSHHLAVLDGLRGVSILLVLLHHYALFGLFPYRGPKPELLVKVLQPFAARGHWGVHLFLIISGFCLYLPIARRSQQVRDVNWKEFFRRRVLRIVPAFYVALPFAVYFAVNQDLAVGLPDILAHLLLVHHLFPWVANINGSFWTLSLEFQLYFLMPLMLLMAQRIGIAKTFIAICGLAIVYRSVLWWSAGGVDERLTRSLAYSAIARAPEFMLGVALAAAYTQGYFDSWTRKTTGLLMAILPLALATALYASSPGDFAPFADLGATLFLGLFVCLALARTIVAKILCARPFVYFGLASYSIYLVHQPLIKPVFTIVTERMQNLWVASAFCLLIVTVTSAVFYFLIERPALRLRAAKATPAVSATAGPQVSEDKTHAESKVVNSAGISG